MIEWININYIEIIGAVLSLIYLALEIKRKWFFWIVGIISSAFYVFIFYKAGLLAEMGLNFYYVIMSVYGLYCWKFASKENAEDTGFCHTNLKTASLLLSISILLFIFLYILLRQFPNSNVSAADALIAVLSIIATWMSAKKIVECWHVWIFANIFASCLYFHQKLYPTAILFIVYSALSFVGLKEWQKSVKKNDSTSSKF